MDPSILLQMPLFGGHDSPIPPDQQAMIARIQNGETIVIDLHAESFRRLRPLLEWAKTHERFIYIARGRDRRYPTIAETLFPEILIDSVWKNPYSTKKFSREQAMAMYANDLLRKSDLLERLPELRGKILGCWCHPEACHGDVLIQRIQSLP